MKRNSTFVDTFAHEADPHLKIRNVKEDSSGPSDDDLTLESLIVDLTPEPSDDDLTCYLEPSNVGLT